MIGATSTCGCGHPVQAHEKGTGACTEWWRYPDVLNARRCGCQQARLRR